MSKKINISEITQEMVNEYPFTKKKPRPKCIGMGDSGRSDLSAQANELLWQDK